MVEFVNEVEKKKRRRNKKKRERGKVMIEKYADELITTAVKGMLPKNKLAKKMIKKLHVFKDGISDKFKQQKFEILGSK